MTRCARLGWGLLRLFMTRLGQRYPASDLVLTPARLYADSRYKSYFILIKTFSSQLNVKYTFFKGAKGNLILLYYMHLNFLNSICKVYFLNGVTESHVSQTLSLYVHTIHSYSLKVLLILKMKPKYYYYYIN